MKNRTNMQRLFGLQHIFCVICDKKNGICGVLDAARHGKNKKKLHGKTSMQL
ncbi:MAG: hypothetical protein RRZ83_00190 [Alistipes sp.]